MASSRHKNSTPFTEIFESLKAIQGPSVSLSTQILEGLKAIQAPLYSTQILEGLKAVQGTLSSTQMLPSLKVGQGPLATQILGGDLKTGQGPFSTMILEENLKAAQGPLATTILEGLKAFQGPSASFSAQVLEGLKAFQGPSVPFSAHVLESLKAMQAPSVSFPTHVYESLKAIQGPSASFSAQILEGLKSMQAPAALLPAHVFESLQTMQEPSAPFSAQLLQSLRTINAPSASFQQHAFESVKGLMQSLSSIADFGFPHATPHFLAVATSAEASAGVLEKNLLRSAIMAVLAADGNREAESLSPSTALIRQVAQSIEDSRHLSGEELTKRAIALRDYVFAWLRRAWARSQSALQRLTLAEICMIIITALTLFIQSQYSERQLALAEQDSAHNKIQTDLAREQTDLARQQTEFVRQQTEFMRQQTELQRRQTEAAEQSLRIEGPGGKPKMLAQDVSAGSLSSHSKAPDTELLRFVEVIRPAVARARPKASSRPVARLQVGQTMLRTSSSRDWVLVQMYNSILDSHIQGWVRKKYLRVVSQLRLPTASDESDIHLPTP